MDVVKQFQYHIQPRPHYYYIINLCFLSTVTATTKQQEYVPIFQTFFKDMLIFTHNNGLFLYIKAIIEEIHIQIPESLPISKFWINTANHFFSAQVTIVIFHFIQSGKNCSHFSAGCAIKIDHPAKISASNLTKCQQQLMIQ